MGIQSARLVLYKSSPLNLSQLYAVLEDRQKESSSQTSHDRRPSVDIDASLIGHRLLYTSCGSAGNVYGLACAISEAGIDVTIVGEVPTRHHSKRVAAKRRAACERARLECHRLRKDLAAMLQQEERPPQNEIKDIEKENCQ